MPIQILESKKRTMLHFGTGDIHISDARMKESDGGLPLVIFHQMTPHPVGSSRPDLHGTECDDFAVGMTFTNPKSIDAVIDVLREFKVEHFPDIVEHEQDLRQQLTASAERERKLREVLQWYQDEAINISKHLQDFKEGRASNAITASLTVLSLDAGRKAEAALASTPAIGGET